jgi:hypothetical protein
MTMRTPTADDVLRREAVNLATDATSFLVRFRETVRPEHAYIVAMECVRIADRIQKARETAFPWETVQFFDEARVAAVRAMVALDRTGAHATLPREETDAIAHRLHDLALALGALAREGEGREPM